jgi:hypothetical protein
MSGDLCENWRKSERGSRYDKSDKSDKTRENDKRPGQSRFLPFGALRCLSLLSNLTIVKKSLRFYYPYTLVMIVGYRPPMIFSESLGSNMTKK